VYKRQHAALLDVYAESGMLVLPSLEETAPMALAQAMAAGKPVITTPVGGIPWMINHGETGYLVEVGDTQQLANRIQELLEDDLKRSRMGEAAKQRARELFLADNIATKTVNVYKELVRTSHYDRS
jgi:glycosyltransferase involved in cell wall biosynthesis